MRDMHFLNLLASVLVVASFAMSPSQTHAQNAQKLADNLSEESCELVTREDLAPLPGVPREQRVICSKATVGSVFGMFGNADPATITAPQLQTILRGSNTGTILSQRINCSGKATLGTGPDTMIIAACRMNSGGWPHVVVMTTANSLLRIAEGPPTTLPALVSALTTKPPGLSRLQWTDVLRTAFAENIPLVSPRELERFSELVRGARAANAQGQHAESERMLRQALDIQSKLLGEGNPAVADTLMDLALSMSNRGRKEEAEGLFARADLIVQKSPKDSDRARLLTYYGFHAANHGDFDAGLKAANNAVAAWRKQLTAPRLNLSAIGGAADDFDPDYLDRGELGLALNLLANMALNLEDLSTATTAAAEALSIFNTTKGLPQWWRSDILLTLGKISSAQGRLSAAETYLNAALKERRIFQGDSPQTIQVLAALGAAYQREGMYTSAIITYREIFKIVRELGIPASEAVTTEELIPFGLAITAFAKTLKDPQQIQGLYAEAFDAFQFVRPANLDQTVNLAAARLASDNPEMQSLLDRLSQAQRTRDTTNTELAFESTLPDDQRSRIVEDRLINQKRQSEAAIKTLESELAQRFPEYRALTHPNPLSLQSVRERLAPEEGLMSFLIGRRQSFVTLIKREGIYIGQIKEGEGSLSETVTALRRALEIQAGSINDYDISRAHQLYQSLFEEIQAPMKGVEHLIVAASGPLASLPFSILVTSPAPASGRYSETAWLMRKTAITHAPSIQSFYTLRSQARAARPTEKLLAIGNPALRGERSAKNSNPGASALATVCRQEGPAPADLVMSLAPLPDTEAEIMAVSRSLGLSGRQHTLLGADATEEKLRQRPLANYSILYFATHGLLPGELKCQAEPGLVLTPPRQSTLRTNDGLLESSEIASMRLNADLVVLSACNTAGGSGRFGGDALSGLAESFFFAGARNLLVSHWQVPSAATTQLMTGLFETMGSQLERGSSPSLRIAQMKMTSLEKTAHPFFWGAFVLVGDGAPESILPLPRGTKAITSPTNPGPNPS